MKIYSSPVPFEGSDYFDYNPAVELAREDAHKGALLVWAKANGYDGKNSGKIFRENVADGYAQYMVVEGGSKFALIHLPYGDGYRSANVQYLPKAEVLRRVDHAGRLATFFAKQEMA